MHCVGGKCVWRGKYRNKRKVDDLQENEKSNKTNCGCCWILQAGLHGIRHAQLNYHSSPKTDR